MDFYKNVLRLLERYFAESGWKKLFLNGGCYWLADTLHQGIASSRIMINRMEEHCALYFDNGLYDIRGRISTKDFHEAKEKEINFMKKNYVPKFDVKRLEQYLGEELRREAGFGAGGGSAAWHRS